MESASYDLLSTRVKLVCNRSKQEKKKANKMKATNAVLKDLFKKVSLTRKIN